MRDHFCVVCLIFGKRLREPSVRDLELMYLTSGPVLALCLQRVNAVKKLLELLGPEDPVQARNVQDLHFWRPAMALTDCITASMVVVFTELFVMLTIW